MRVTGFGQMWHHRAMQIPLEDLNIANAERKLCAEALQYSATLDEAAQRLGCTTKRLVRLLAKHNLKAPRGKTNGAK